MFLPNEASARQRLPSPDLTLCQLWAGTLSISRNRAPLTTTTIMDRLPAQSGDQSKSPGMWTPNFPQWHIIYEHCIQGL